MCDTLVALPASTGSTSTLFGKNSDRQRNEAHRVELMPRASHAPEAVLHCTYIAIPQVAATHAALLCRPFWIWGAEMGANEHGVVIGNEAVHAQSSPPEVAALTGMDLLRLGLERATTAAEAVDVMTELLDRHGQGGNCGHLKPSFYNNSFLIADAAEAFVVETIERDWLVERVRDSRAISNIYSIAGPLERGSAGLDRRLHNFGWAGQGGPDYAAIIRHPENQHISRAAERRDRANDLLRQSAGRLGVADVQRILRDHGGATREGEAWHPRTVDGPGICMHAGSAARGGQTTGSLVSDLAPRSAVHWVTATSSPCLSIFKPVLLDAALPPFGPKPTDRFDRATLWWRHELLHRHALAGDLASVIADIRDERDALERDFQVRIDEVRWHGSAAERTRAVDSCWEAACATEKRWLARLPAYQSRAPSDFDSSWTAMNRLAGLNLEQAVAERP